jgi:spore coat protein U-like protein
MKWSAIVWSRPLSGFVCLAAFLGSATTAQAMACSVTSFSGSYGAVIPLSGLAVDSTASFSVTCSGGSANQGVRLCMNIGPGTTTTGPSGERVLRSSSSYLDHEFYFNSGRTQLWGSWGIGSSSPYPSGSPAGIQQDVTLNSSGSGTFNPGFPI